MSTKHGQVGLSFRHGGHSGRQILYSTADHLPGLPSLISTARTVTVMSECSPWLQSRLGVRRPTSGGATPIVTPSATSGRSSTPSRIFRRSGRNEPSFETITLQRIECDVIKAMAKLSEQRPASRERTQQPTRRTGTKQSKPLLTVSLYPHVRSGSQQRQQPTEIAPVFVGSRNGNAALDRAITVLRDRQLTVRLMTAATTASPTRPMNGREETLSNTIPELSDQLKRSGDEVDSSRSVTVEAVGSNSSTQDINVTGMALDTNITGMSI